MYDTHCHILPAIDDGARALFRVTPAGVATLHSGLPFRLPQGVTVLANGDPVQLEDGATVTDLLAATGLERTLARRRAQLLYRALIGDFVWRAHGGRALDGPTRREIVDLLLRSDGGRCLETIHLRHRNV